MKPQSKYPHPPPLDQAQEPTPGDVTPQADRKSLLTAGESLRLDMYDLFGETKFFINHQYLLNAFLLAKLEFPKRDIDICSCDYQVGIVIVDHFTSLNDHKRELLLRWFKSVFGKLKSATQTDMEVRHQHDKLLVFLSERAKRAQP